MTTEKFNAIVEDFISKTKNTLVKKTAEYNLNKDRLELFKKAANLNNNNASQTLLGFVSKQITSLYSMIQSGKAYTETLWTDRMFDIINYMVLLRGTLEDDDLITPDTQEIHNSTVKNTAKKTKLLENKEID